MKFTDTDLNLAVVKLSMLKFFPTDPLTQSAVMDLMCDMCESKEALNWLVAEMVNRIGEWRGPKEFRGLLCTKFMPADGIEAFCSIPGYRPCDFEARAIEQHEQLKAGGWVPKEIEDKKLVKLLADSKRWLQ